MLRRKITAIIKAITDKIIIRLIFFRFCFVSFIEQTPIFYEGKLADLPAENGIIIPRLNCKDSPHGYFFPKMRVICEGNFILKLCGVCVISCLSAIKMMNI